MSFDFTLSIPLWVLLVLVLFHWLGDFVLQSDEVAKGKSKHLGLLGRHIGAYTLSALIPAAVALMPGDATSVWRWIAINAGLHFAVDFVTSRMSAHFFAKGDVHNGFVVIGFDQLLHLVCLVLTTVLIAQ